MSEGKAPRLAAVTSSSASTDTLSRQSRNKGADVNTATVTTEADAYTEAALLRDKSSSKADAKN